MAKRSSAKTAFALRGGKKDTSRCGTILLCVSFMVSGFRITLIVRQPHPTKQQ